MGILELVEPAWWTVERGGLAAGVATAVIALNTMRLNRLSIRESHRPMMVAQLEHGEKARSPLDLVVSNVGRSPAHHVQVTFDPALPDVQTSKDGQQSMIPFLRKRYAQTFPVWPPGVERRNAYWFIHGEPNEHGEVESVDGLPREVTAVIRYKLGPRTWSQPITECYPLRISEMENESFTTIRTHSNTHRLT